MPYKTNDVQLDQTKTIVLSCLEKKDKDGNYMFWSIKEIADEAQKVSGTIHYHLNPFIANGVIEVKYSKHLPQTPVYRIKNGKEYLKVKEKVLATKIKASKRTKLRELKKIEGIT